MTVTEFPCTCRQGLSTCSTLGTGTLAEASPRLWSLSSVVLGEVHREQALSALLWLTGLPLCFVTLRMELLTFSQTGCLQSLLFGDKAASCNFFSNCPYLITQGQVISPGSMTLSVASHSASPLLLDEAQLAPQPYGPNTEDWLSSDIIGPAVAPKRSWNRNITDDLRGMSDNHLPNTHS